LAFSVIVLIIGAALLVKGAHWLIDGGAGIALKSGVSHLIVGLTVVAFGTSAPELVASLIAAFKGSGDICFGNVVGSNVANIALILGVTSLLQPVSVNQLLVKWEIPFMIGISGVTFYIGHIQNAGRLTGIILLILFAYYLIHCMKSPPVPMEVDEVTARKKYRSLIFLVILGVAGLGFGGLFFVNGARNIARVLGVSEAIIGLTIVALGTSLPELVTSAIAALKGHADISLGNIVGSNIFNILLVIGATATLRPYSISHDRFLTVIGMPFMMGLAVLLLPFAIIGNRISRIEGALFFILYSIYCVFAVLMA
jgi:cation:H+ antiporter